MLERNTIVTLDNEKKYVVLSTLTYKEKNYALLSDLKDENRVVLVEKDDKGVFVSLINSQKEEELVLNIFLKNNLKELDEYNKKQKDSEE